MILNETDSSLFYEYMMQYEELIESVSNAYLGEPTDEHAQLNLDSVGWVLLNAPISIPSNNSSESVIPNGKELFGYHLMRVGLHIQQKEFDKANQLLVQDKIEFNLTEKQLSEIDDLIAVIELQKQLYNQELKWDSIPTQTINYLETIANLKYEEMATPFAISLLSKYGDRRFDAKLFVNTAKNENKTVRTNKGSIYPNPTTDILNLPSTCVGYEIMDLNGKVITKQIELNTAQINVEFLKEGMYIIKLIHADNTISSEKFSKL